MKNDLILGRQNLIKRKLVVIPTTAGSGEVTSNAVMYINNIKYSFEGQELIIDNFLIPELILKIIKKLKLPQVWML